jgi:hypothetical protein
MKWGWELGPDQGSNARKWRNIELVYHSHCTWRFNDILSRRTFNSFTSFAWTTPG